MAAMSKSCSAAGISNLGAEVSDFAEVELDDFVGLDSEEIVSFSFLSLVIADFWMIVLCDFWYLNRPPKRQNLGIIELAIFYLSSCHLSYLFRFANFLAPAVFQNHYTKKE